MILSLSEDYQKVTNQKLVAPWGSNETIMKQSAQNVRRFPKAPSEAWAPAARCSTTRPLHSLDLRPAPNRPRPQLLRQGSRESGMLEANESNDSILSCTWKWMNILDGHGWHVGLGKSGNKTYG